MSKLLYRLINKLIGRYFYKGYMPQWLFEMLDKLAAKLEKRLPDEWLDEVLFK